MSSASLGSQDEVGPVEDVEPLRLELHVYAFRKLEGLCQGHVSTYVAWSDKRVPAEIADATEAGGAKSWQTGLRRQACISGWSPAVSPSLARKATEPRKAAVWPVITAVIEIIVPT